MRVNNYKIRIKELSGTTGVVDPVTGDIRYTNINAINIPLSQTPWLSGQQEIIDTKFIDVEVENAINDIFDYEKVRLIPRLNNDEKCGEIVYKVKFLNRNNDGQLTDVLSYNDNTTWASDLGDVENKFVYDDFKFYKNSFTKSFLRLDFYDSDIGTSQRLLFFVTLFPKFTRSDYTSKGTVPDPSNYEISFVLGNSIENREANGEGFFLYYFKDEVLPTLPKNLYMKATFANAKSGKATRLMSSNNPNNSIDVLTKTTMNSETLTENKLYTLYQLQRDTNGYYYKINSDYSSNVSHIGNSINIKLYEISAL